MAKLYIKGAVGPWRFAKARTVNSAQNEVVSQESDGVTSAYVGVLVDGKITAIRKMNAKHEWSKA